MPNQTDDNDDDAFQLGASNDGRPRSRRLAIGRWIVLPAVLVGVVTAALFWPAEPPAQPAGGTPVHAWTAATEQLRDDPTRLSTPGPVTDAEVLSLDLAEHAGLESVQINSGNLTDPAAEHLAGLPTLREFRLVDCPITDAVAPSLADHPTLRVLNLPNSRLTNDGVRELARSTSLRTLRIGSAAFDSSVCAAIATIETLRMLHLIDVAVTDDDLRRLTTLPHLETLYLDGASVTDGGYRWLFEHYPNLHVHIDQLHRLDDPRAHVH